MNVAEITITAGEKRQIQGGRFFKLLDTDSQVDVVFKVNNQPLYKAIGVKGGFEARPEVNFDMVEISSATTQTIKYGVSYGEGGDTRLVGEVTVSQPSQIVDYPDVTITGSVEILAANASRKRALIHNNSTTSTARVGGPALVFGKGIALYPQTTIEIEGTAAIYVWGTNIPVSRQEHI